MTITRSRVTRVTSNGFQIEDEEGWFNLSKLGPALQKGPPNVGAFVEFEWDEWQGKPWVKDWEYHVEPSRDPGWHKDLSQAEDGPSAWLHDDRPVVTRLACLNAALHFWDPGAMKFQPNTGSIAEGYSEAAILGTAERFVAWATWGGGDQWQEEIDPDQDLDGYEPGPETSTSVGPPPSTSPIPASSPKEPARPTRH